MTAQVRPLATYDDLLALEDDVRAEVIGGDVSAAPSPRSTPRDVVRPDLSGWRRERLPQPGSKRPIDVVPDWVCEIVSPSTGGRDRVTKRALYAKHRAGVRGATR